MCTTGNFGNILGAYYAKKMGIPIRNLVVACNENNIVHDFFSCGEYNISNRVLHKTASPAIDILKSSNLERYIFEAGKKRISTANLFNELEKHKKFEIDCKSELFQTIQQDFLTGWCSSDESLHTIKDVFRRTGYLMDPHTGVAKNVADQLSLGQ
ncbi:THNSL1 [Bugula neritina]|uniref:THNSL1 n=1 Tax=Bugula neritina TaxID=10212 RepID=A0A7J7JWC6_BUGNE|nr:THNSL1 [Bugula neritina]